MLDIIQNKPVKLWQVLNSNNKSVFCIAPDKEIAKKIAWMHGHVTKPINAFISEGNIEFISEQRPKFASSIHAAVSARAQGLIEDVDGYALVTLDQKRKIFAPLSIVD